MRHLVVLLLAICAAAVFVAWMLWAPVTPVVPVVQASAGPRVVSLSPALSRTAVLLGLEARLVGRSRFCTFLEDSIPIVGDLLAIDFERLVTIDPTDLLVQPPATGVDPALGRLAGENSWELHPYPSLNTLGDVFAMARSVAHVMTDEGTERRAALARATALETRLQSALDQRPPGFTGKVLLVHSVDPVGVFGAGTYLDEMLTRLGATNSVSASGWLTLSLEDVVRLDPDAIVLVRLMPGDWTDAGGALVDLSCEAVRSGRVAVLDHPDVLYPSPALAEVAERLRDLLAEWGAGSPAS